MKKMVLQKKLIEIYNEINESENAVCYLTPDDKDVIKSAIKALKQEPCDDCISRTPVKKAIDKMLEWIESDNRHNCDYFIVDKIEEIIKELSIDTLQSVYPKTNVLDKIRAEIEETYGSYDICERVDDYDYEENNISEFQRAGKVSDILAIIDKYKAESEVKE